MVKGDKIVDLRDNSVHIIDSIDVYDTVTLVFTEGKQYIPINHVKFVGELMKKMIEKFSSSIKPKNEKILTAAEFQKLYYKTKKKSQFSFLKKVRFNLKNIFK